MQAKNTVILTNQKIGNNSNSTNNNNEIGLGKIGKKLTPLLRTNKANGYALIVLVVLVFAALVVLTKPILTTNVRQFRDTNLEYAKDVSETVGIASASHIRERINNTIYGRIQGKLIDHARRFNSEADTYQCQGQTFATKKGGGRLRSSFSICELNGIFDDLLGDTNQTVDLIGTVYPNHKTPVEDKKMDGLRKDLIEQMKNKFDYSLRTIFVNQEVLNDATGNRVDRYRYQVRADVETKTFFNVVDQFVIHYDVIIDTVTHDQDFGGAGNACDPENAQAPSDLLIDPPDIPYTGPDGKTYIISGDGGGVFPLYVKDDQVPSHEYQYGSQEYKNICGTLPNGVADPYCRKKKSEMSSGACGSQYGGDLNCGFSDGTGFYGYQTPPSIRVIGGCASARTNQVGQRGLDFGGYNFTITTRLTSIGSTFN